MDKKNAQLHKILVHECLEQVSETQLIKIGVKILRNILFFVSMLLHLKRMSFKGIGQTRSLLGAIGAKNRRAYSYRANYALENRQCVIGAIGAVKI